MKSNMLKGLLTAAVASSALLAGSSGAYAYKLAGFSGLASDAYWISLMCGGTKAAAAGGSSIDWYAVKTGNDAAGATANFEAIKVQNQMASSSRNRAPNRRPAMSKA